MEICIKDTLRTLRQKNNITQELLANHLGITAQSVGKWERGEGFPDITLLPNIALFFGVTIDDLLNVGQARIDEKIKMYQEESLRYKNQGENEKNLILWEKAYAEFPNDCRVMEGLMYAINRNAQYPCPIEDANRIISLGKRILSESTDSKLRENAIEYLCYTYNSINDLENAIYYANMGGSIYTTREELRSFVLTGEEGIEACQKYIVAVLCQAAMTASTMTIKSAFSPDEEIVAYQFGIDLMKLLFSDGNVGFYANDISWRYSRIAECYAKMRNVEKTLEALEECTKYSKIAANVTETQYTAPMVNHLKTTVKDITKNYRGNACNLRLQALEQNCYDFIRENERFQKIIKKLNQYAE